MALASVLDQNATKITQYSGETAEDLFRQADHHSLLGSALEARIATATFYRFLQKRTSFFIMRNANEEANIALIQFNFDETKKLNCKTSQNVDCCHLRHFVPAQNWISFRIFFSSVQRKEPQIGNVAFEFYRNILT